MCWLPAVGPVSCQCALQSGPEVPQDSLASYCGHLGLCQAHIRDCPCWAVGSHGCPTSNTFLQLQECSDACIASEDYHAGVQAISKEASWRHTAGQAKIAIGGKLQVDKRQISKGSACNMRNKACRLRLSHTALTQLLMRLACALDSQQLRNHLHVLSTPHSCSFTTSSDEGLQLWCSLCPHPAKCTTQPEASHYFQERLLLRKI